MRGRGWCDGASRRKTPARIGDKALYTVQYTQKGRRIPGTCLGGVPPDPGTDGAPPFDSATAPRARRFVAAVASVRLGPTRPFHSDPTSSRAGHRRRKSYKMNCSQKYGTTRDEKDANDGVDGVGRGPRPPVGSARALARGRLIGPARGSEPPTPGPIMQRVLFSMAPFLVGHPILGLPVLSSTFIALGPLGPPL